MFMVLLKFSVNKALAGQFMAAHNAWINNGFDEGIFLLVGSLQPNQGGSVVAHNTTLANLQKRVNEDPFVIENVVSVEILEIAPGKVDKRLAFLME